MEYQVSDEPTPLDLIDLDKPGYEVWASHKTSSIAGHQVPKLLIVVYEESADPVITVIDPHTNEEVLFAEEYVEVLDYLSDNEYVLVEGQMEIPPDQRDEEDH